MKILVTGGSGYIASWIISNLLDDGHQLVTTVRNLADENKINHLQELAINKPGKLSFAEADLLKEGSFDEAVKGCEVVIHSASPFKIAGIKDTMKELVEPAVKGTENVLRAVNRENGVRKVVLTSSIAAIYGDGTDKEKVEGGVFTEEHWNTSSNARHQAYSYSKKAAEEAAWKMANEQQRWKLAVINPGFVIGPSITKRTDSTSIDFMLSFLNGKYQSGAPELYFGMVDVRDVAKAHVAAAYKDEAEGRHITVSETYSTVDVAQKLRDYLGDSYKIPKRKMPKFMLYVAGPFVGFSWKFVSRNVGIPIYFDNSRAKQALGIEFTPVEQSIRDQADQIIKDGLV